MASKGMKNLFGGIFGGKPPKQAGADAPQPDKIPGEIRKRENAMRGKLENIKNGTLFDPQRRLSAEKEKELNITGVINYALSQLKYPLISEQNIINMDNNISYIIDALEDAIKNNYEMTAEWACTALVFAIKNLRIDIPDVDKHLATELMECRVQYSENLRLLVELCREHDHTVNTLAEQTRRRQEKRDKLDDGKADYQIRLNRGDLNAARAELQMYIHDPSKLSDEALALRDELANLHLLKSSILEIDTTINADQVLLNTRKAQIDSRRNALANPPHVHDPKLHDRINEANRRFREQLRRALDEADQGMKDYNVHISAMQDLANHSVHSTTVAMAIQMDQDMQMEAYRAQQIATNAAQITLRSEQNIEALEANVKAQEEEHQRILEQRQEVIRAQEKVVNTEVEYDYG